MLATWRHVYLKMGVGMFLLTLTWFQNCISTSDTFPILGIYIMIILPLLLVVIIIIIVITINFIYKIKNKELWQTSESRKLRKTIIRNKHTTFKPNTRKLSLRWVETRRQTKVKQYESFQVNWNKGHKTGKITDKEKERKSRDKLINQINKWQ